ncbi:MAG: hypothetical protein ACP5NE_02490 [Candidatus Micrarchaeia archaeon]
MNSFVAVAVSLVVVALTIYAIALFITSGASEYFYVVVGIALAIGLVNSWLISSGRYEGKEGHKTEVRREVPVVSLPEAKPSPAGKAARAVAKPKGKAGGTPKKGKFDNRKSG